MLAASSKAVMASFICAVSDVSTIVSWCMQEDWIGLKQLDQSGRVTLEECPGQHMHVTLDWFATHVIQAHLKA